MSSSTTDDFVNGGSVGSECIAYDTTSIVIAGLHTAEEGMLLVSLVGPHLAGIKTCVSTIFRDSLLIGESFFCRSGVEKLER